MTNEKKEVLSSWREPVSQDPLTQVQVSTVLQDEKEVLMKFYGVTTVDDLISAQHKHIVKLQQSNVSIIDPLLGPILLGRVREG